MLGLDEEHAPVLQKLNLSLVGHFDKGGKVRSKMKLVMREVEHFARLEGVWLEVRWTVPAVTKMWSTIWRHLEPYLRTVTTRKDGKVTDKKSRQGQIAWRTCYNKLIQDGKKIVPSKIVRARAMFV